MTFDIRIIKNYKKNKTYSTTDLIELDHSFLSNCYARVVQK